MAKNQHGENSTDLCEKIYNATFRPAFRKIHGVSNCPMNSKPANTAPNPSLSFSLGEVIPIESDSQPLPKLPSEKEKKIAKKHADSFQKNERLTEVAVVASSVKGVATKEKPPHDKGEEGSKKLGQDDVNGRTLDYIDRVKAKMRSKSNVGGGKSVSRRDSFNDRVTNYLNRARIKIRTTSGVGGGKSDSFK